MFTKKNSFPYSVLPVTPVLSNTTILGSSIEDPVSHPYKTSTVIAWHVLIVNVLNKTQK
jgi:hypothetical protein